MDRFLRHELKLVLNAAEARSIREWAAKNLRPDPNATNDDASYLIQSLYLDNQKLEVFHRSLADQKPHDLAQEEVLLGRLQPQPVLGVF